MNVNKKLYTIYFPFLYEILSLFFTYLFIYVKIPFLTILIIILQSFIYSVNKNIERITIYFIILSFSLPYGFISLSNFSSLGNYINEYVIAGIPLYFYIIFQIRIISFKDFTKTHKIIFFSLLILIMISTGIPGLSKMIGIGGYRVRLAFFMNFVNSLILFYCFTKVKLNKDYIKTFYFVIVNLGFIFSLVAIIQYFFKVSLVPNFTDDVFNYSRLFLFNSVNSNACIPFLLFPFSLVMVKISKFSFLWTDLIKLITFLAAIFLTQTRVAYLSVLVIIFIILFKNKSLLKSIIYSSFIFLIVFSSILFVKFDDRLSNTGTITTRFYLWGLALTAIQDAPIIGYGIGNQTKNMFKKETDFLFFQINESNSVDTFQKQSVHQYLLDGILSHGIFFLIPFTITFITMLRFKIDNLGFDIYSQSFYMSLRVFFISFCLFLLINVSQQHYLYFSLIGFIKKRQIE